MALKAEPFWCGPPVSWVLDELELGRRVASSISCEQEGWGAWIDPKIFETNLNPVVLQSDWTRDLNGVDPYAKRSPKRIAHFPSQRKPS